MDDGDKDVVSGHWTGRELPASDAANNKKRPLYWGGLGGVMGIATAQGHWLLSAVVIAEVFSVWIVW